MESAAFTPRTARALLLGSPLHRAECGRSAATLISELDDELYALNARLGEDVFPRTAQAYLDEWASPEKGWLRKYYPAGTDEAHYDVTPPVEKALLWVKDLQTRDFVGTESRLNTLFDLLRQMVFGADADPASQLAQLRRQRAELDAKIARAERGEVTLLDSTSQRDRYYQFTRNARELLADFREVEDNFRALDRRLRERIAGWAGSKGELLDEVFGSKNSITDSDQGRSFQALFDFLLSHRRQAELTELLDRLAEIEDIGEHDSRLQHLHFDWIDAGERTQATVRLLSEQLRRFLDDQVWLENRRVFDLLRSIESRAVALRQHPPALEMELDDMAAGITLPFERPLYAPHHAASLSSEEVAVGSGDFDASALLDQIHIDREELAQTVRDVLRDRTQVALAPVVAEHPLSQGLAELVGYLSLSDPSFEVIFDETGREQIAWEAESGVTMIADGPGVTFARRTAGAR
jgi:flagellar motility protein MotE (MotC chaperone)